MTSLAANGHREIVLTGIHLGAYGRELADGTKLHHVIRTINKVEGVERIRLSSIEPMDISDELISEMDLPVNSEYIEKVVSLGFEVKQKSKWFNGVSGYVTKSELGLISQLSTVKSLDVVHKFKKDYSIEEDAGNQPQGNSLYKQNGINSFNYGQSFTQLNQINVPAVHDMGYTGQGITICSMDAGFDNLEFESFTRQEDGLVLRYGGTLAHPDFRGRIDSYLWRGSCRL